MQKLNTAIQKAPWTLGLALFFFAASLFTLFVWIPFDIETGVIETFRRRTTIGDAMAPTVMAAGILIASILMAGTAIFRPDTELNSDGLDKQSFSFIGRLILAIGLGLVLMLYAGPVFVDLVNVMGGEVGTYRNLRATYPYKLIGYVIGGFVLVFGAISVVENRFSKGAALASILAVVVLTLLYEVPFDNLLLPPNGNN